MKKEEPIMAKKKNFYLYKKYRNHYALYPEQIISCSTFTRQQLIAYLAFYFKKVENLSEFNNYFSNNSYKTLEDFSKTPLKGYAYYNTKLSEERIICNTSGKVINVNSILKEVEERLIIKEKNSLKPRKKMINSAVFRVDSVPHTGKNYWKCHSNYSRNTHGEKQRLEEYDFYRNGNIVVEIGDDDITYHIKTKHDPEWHGGGRSLYYSKSWKKDKKCKRQWMKHLDKRKTYGSVPDVTLEEELLLMEEF